MPVPVLLITGFLGAGKTTLINRLLSDPAGRRLAAVVNDFGAINIDAALLGSVSDDVINLKNGCICCSLMGDLLQTLSTLLRRHPVPDGIVIETSGVSDPAEIVRTLLDPVIWKEAALETAICVVDARMVTDQPGLFDDPLWRSQVAGADFIAVSKIDLVTSMELDHVKSKLEDVKAGRMIYEMLDGRLPSELHFSCDGPRTLPAPAEPATGSHHFQTISWTSASPLLMTKFQHLVSQLSKSVIRAKGFVTFVERPDEPMLFQLVGNRATIGRASSNTRPAPRTQLVFIARRGALDEFWLTGSLAACRVDG